MGWGSRRHHATLVAVYRDTLQRRGRRVGAGAGYLGGQPKRQQVLSGRRDATYLATLNGLL